MQNLVHFLRNDAGAVTVDFVVLTAAICTLGAAVVFTVTRGSELAAERIGSSLQSAEIPPVGPN